MKRPRTGSDLLAEAQEDAELDLLGQQDGNDEYERDLIADQHRAEDLHRLAMVDFLSTYRDLDEESQVSEHPFFDDGEEKKESVFVPVFNGDQTTNGDKPRFSLNPLATPWVYTVTDGRAGAYRNVAIAQIPEFVPGKIDELETNNHLVYHYVNDDFSTTSFSRRSSHVGSTLSLHAEEFDSTSMTGAWHFLPGSASLTPCCSDSEDDDVVSLSPLHKELPKLPIPSAPNENDLIEEPYTLPPREVFPELLLFQEEKEHVPIAYPFDLVAFGVVPDPIEEVKYPIMDAIPAVPAPEPLDLPVAHLLHPEEQKGAPVHHNYFPLVHIVPQPLPYEPPHVPPFHLGPQPVLPPPVVNPHIQLPPIAPFHPPPPPYPPPHLLPLPPLAPPALPVHLPINWEERRLVRLFLDDHLNDVAATRSMWKNVKNFMMRAVARLPGIVTDRSTSCNALVDYKGSEMNKMMENNCETIRFRFMKKGRGFTLNVGESQQFVNKEYKWNEEGYIFTQLYEELVREITLANRQVLNGDGEVLPALPQAVLYVTTKHARYGDVFARDPDVLDNTIIYYINEVRARALRRARVRSQTPVFRIAPTLSS